MKVFYPHIRRYHFKTILIDPPWKFKVRSEKGLGRSAERHYKTMTIKEIMALPIKEFAANDAVVLMWITDPMIKYGLRILKAWGFEYKTVGLYWIKMDKTAKGRFDVFMGGGYWSRANPEQLWLATTGNPKRKSKGVHRVMFAPVREHSQKPEETIARIEKLLHGPYLEIFGRQERPGWIVAGDQSDKFNRKPAIVPTGRIASPKPGPGRSRRGHPLG